MLRDVVDTEVSPELVPGAEEATKTDEGGAASQPGQSTEASIGPYELQDFHLYHTLRYGFPPTKVAFLAYVAWHDRTPGDWPEGIGAHNQYTLAEIKRHLRHLPAPLLQDQPVQALVRAERAEGRIGRLAVAARRLARAERFERCGVAGRPGAGAGGGRGGADRDGAAAGAAEGGGGEGGYAEKGGVMRGHGG